MLNFLNNLLKFNLIIGICSIIKIHCTSDCHNTLNTK